MTAQHGTHNKYTCDFICNCPANDTAERVTREVIATLREGVEGLETFDGRIISKAKVLALITDIEKAGE